MQPGEVSGRLEEGRRGRRAGEGRVAVARVGVGVHGGEVRAGTRRAMAAQQPPQRAVAASEEQSLLLAAAGPSSGSPSTATALGVRHAMASVMFLGAMLAYAQRIGLPIAIVRMQPELGWDKSTQGSLLSSFYLGCERCPPRQQRVRWAGVRVHGGR